MYAGQAFPEPRWQPSLCQRAFIRGTGGPCPLILFSRRVVPSANREALPSSPGFHPPTPRPFSRSAPRGSSPLSRSILGAVCPQPATPELFRACSPQARSGCGLCFLRRERDASQLTPCGTQHGWWHLPPRGPSRPAGARLQRLQRREHWEARALGARQPCAQRGPGEPPLPGL